MLAPVMANLDWTVFHWVNGQAGQHGWLDELGKAASSQLELVVVATLIGGWLLMAGLHLRRERTLPRGLLTVALTAGIALAAGLVANQIIGNVWFRERPYAGHSSAHLIVGPSSDPSFASDHATAGFALSLGAIRGLPRVAALLFVETVLMSVGRVYVGLHYPGDILGGLGLAAGAALAASAVTGLARPAIDQAVALVNGYAEGRRWPFRVS